MSLVTLAPQKMMACFCSLCFVVPSLVSFLYFVVWNHSRMWMWFQCPEAISLSAHSPCFGRGQGCVCVWMRGGGGGSVIYPLWLILSLHYTRCNTRFSHNSLLHYIVYMDSVTTTRLSLKKGEKWNMFTQCFFFFFFFTEYFSILIVQF